MTQPNFSLKQQVYAQSVGTTSTNYPILSDRDPTSNDTNYPVGQFWINKTSEDFFYMNGLSAAVSVSNPYGQMQATWVPFNQAAQLSFVSDSETANPLNDVINFVGANGVTTSATGSTITVSGNYSTGLWTPTIAIGGVVITTGGYTTQLGGVTVVGNLVSIWADILLSSKQGLTTGAITIPNLPIGTGANGAAQALTVSLFQGWTLANYTTLSLILSNNSDIGTFAASGSGQAAVLIAAAQISDTFNVRFNATYLVD
jgi:hypothetical protein